MALGAYDIVVANGTTARLGLPDLSMAAILKIAFKDKYISDPEHLVLRRLRGEV